MAKILALDFGMKRIGYAVSDEGQTISFPRGFFLRKPEQKLLYDLEALCRNDRIAKIIVGLPLGEENEETRTSKKARAFGEKLGRALLLPVTFIDEFGSTQEALSKIPTSKERREPGRGDAVAAQVILQRYLDVARPRAERDDRGD